LLLKTVTIDFDLSSTGFNRHQRLRFCEDLSMCLDDALKSARIGQWIKSRNSMTGITIYLSVTNSDEAGKVIENTLINHTQFSNINIYKK
jgi:hypothetical protein